MAKHILAVDDDEAFLDFLRRSLPQYRVTTVNTSEQALAEARLHRPDLILLDVNLPVLDGFDLCEMLRTEGVPILFISGSPYRDQHERTAFTGAVGYLEKPVKPDVLREWVKRAVKKGTTARRKAAAE